MAPQIPVIAVGLGPIPDSLKFPEILVVKLSIIQPQSENVGSCEHVLEISDNTCTSVSDESTIMMLQIRSHNYVKDYIGVHPKCHNCFFFVTPKAYLHCYSANGSIVMNNMPEILV